MTMMMMMMMMTIMKMMMMMLITRLNKIAREHIVSKTPQTRRHRTHHTSHITHHTSHITHHTSHITRQPSHVSQSFRPRAAHIIAPAAAAAALPHVLHPVVCRRRAWRCSLGCSPRYRNNTRRIAILPPAAAAQRHDRPRAVRQRHHSASDGRQVAPLFRCWLALHFTRATAQCCALFSCAGRAA